MGGDWLTAQSVLTIPLIQNRKKKEKKKKKRRRKSNFRNNSYLKDLVVFHLKISSF